MMTSSLALLLPAERILLRLLDASPESALFGPRAADDADAQAALAVHEDPERFLEIFQRHYGTIFSYLYRRTLERDMAEDLTSRTFHAAFEHLRTRARRDLQVRPWLYRIATNMHLSHERTSKRFYDRFPALAWARELIRPSQPDDQLMRQATSDEIRAALLALPERYRTPLILRFYEEMDYEEIALTLGLAEGSVRSRVSRGIVQLRSELTRSRTNG